MQNTNNFKQNSGPPNRVKIISVDGLVRRVQKPVAVKFKAVQRPAVVVSSKQKTTAPRKFVFLDKLYKDKKVPVLVAVLALIIAFGGGMWSVFVTTKTKAESESQVLGAYTDQPFQDGLNRNLSTENNLIAVSAAPVATGQGNKIPNEVLLSLTIDQLEGYLTEALKTPEVRQAEILAIRKEKLKAYLAEKKSPFVAIINTIAELKHWKMVLAISNSESTLGKHCYTNNCSGIGVEPGHPLWREYNSTADWAKDLDRLIEKRYKNWTLEKMNGVYNQPGSKNWILAAKQVLEGLQERGID